MSTFNVFVLIDGKWVECNDSPVIGFTRKQLANQLREKFENKQWKIRVGQ